MSLVTWEDLVAEPDDPEDSFIIDPYIVEKGVTFLWGETSSGKSPLTWHMAKAIGEGKDFFGLPVKRKRNGLATKVLYIEADTPRKLVKERLKGNKKYVAKRPILQPAPNVWLYDTPPLTIPTVPARYLDPLLAAYETVQPDVVFVNTLRKMSTLDDKDSATPPKIMGFFRDHMPDAAVVLIHHPRKAPTAPGQYENEKESFSGSNAWINDSQVGLQLQRYRGGKGEKCNLKLIHKKAQGTELVPPLRLYLDESPASSGMLLSSPAYDEMLLVYEMLNAARVNGDELGTALDQKIADALGCSPTTAWRRRQHIEKGHFPGTRLWLGDGS